MPLAGKTVRISHPIIETESSTWTFENIAYMDRDFVLQTGGDISARNLDNVRILLALVQEYCERDVSSRPKMTNRQLLSKGEQRLLSCLTPYELDAYQRSRRLPVNCIVRLIEWSTQKLKTTRMNRSDFELVDVDVIEDVM